MRSITRWWRIPALALALSTGGCAQAGALGDILGTGSPTNEALLQGDVVLVNANQQYLQVRDINGRLSNVRFDGQTQVVYQNRAYPVTALEPGDEVSISLQQTQQGELYTNQILVTRSIQEIRGTTGAGGAQYLQMTGTVGQIDHQRGMFELRPQAGGSIWVSLPYNASDAIRRRFQQLRTNEQVRVGGYQIAGDRLELSAFL